jgi:phenylacetate-CoA ligase
LQRRYFDPIETAPRAEIERVQLRRLTEQLQHTYEKSALVRREWDRVGLKPGDIRSVGDFKARAPFIEKATIQRHRAETGDPMGGVLAGDSAEVTLYGTSSGTTGDPTLFAESWTARGEMVFTPREIWESGLRPGDFLIDVQMVIRSIGRLYFQDMGATPIFFHHDASDVSRMIDACFKYRPTWMFHISSPLIYALERLEAETKVDLRDAFSSFKGVIYGGEPMGRHNRDLMERWGVPVFEFTSLGDCGTAWECQARDGFHAWEDLVLFEVVDPETGAPVPSGGRGEMVCTALVDKLDPLVRFRSGDLVRWSDEKCDCGRTHARYWPLGRAGDETLVNGRSVMPTDIWPAIESVPETASGLFQIIRPQRELSELKLRVGYDGAPDLADLAERVARAVEKATGLRPAVELMANTEIVKFGPPHKIPRTSRQ